MRAAAARSLRLPALLAILMLAIIVLASATPAFVPQAERIALATAKANAAASRSQALQLDLTLRVAGREPIGTGTLITHPSGLARLELRDAAGRLERHLRVVTEYAASRNGEELERPRAFLPPLSFLQVDSPATLQQALVGYGVEFEAASVAPCGTRICYVLGDPARVAPPPPEPLEPTDQSPATHDEPRDEPEPSAAPAAEAAPIPTIWIDSQSFEIVRIDAQSGVVVRFGPIVEFDDIRFPDSITIDEPEREPVRFDILGITAVNAPAAGFSRSWLLTPPGNRPEEQSLPPTTPAGR